jgi:chromosome partitioning protein
MQTIAISINKGGQGKTLLSKSLAVAASLEQLNTLILDLDTQGNSASWGKRRRAEHPELPLPLAQFCTENELGNELAHASKAGCDLVVIDTPPGRSSEALAAVEASDLVLIPFWYDLDSFDGVTRTALLCRRLGKPAFGVYNFATPNSRYAEQAREVLASIPLDMVPTVISRYEVHRAANIRGLTAQELEPASAAATQITSLWQWLSAQLHLGTTAHVHKGAA